MRCNGRSLDPLVSMPRYFFHIERDGARILDEKGSTHADLHNVQEVAVQAAADLAAEELKHCT